MVFLPSFSFKNQIRKNRSQADLIRPLFEETWLLSKYSTQIRRMTEILQENEIKQLTEIGLS